MSRLDDYLELPNISETRKDIKVKVNGKERVYTIKPMTVEQHKGYQNRCRSKFKSDGLTFDSSKFYQLIFINHVVDPDFSNADFLQKVGFETATAFINAKIVPGVITEVATKICEFSGFSAEIQDDIDEAKN